MDVCYKRRDTEQETEHVIVPKNTYKMYCGREPRFYISVLYNEEYTGEKISRMQKISLPISFQVVKMVVLLMTLLVQGI